MTALLPSCVLPHVPPEAARVKSRVVGEGVVVVVVEVVPQECRRWAATMPRRAKPPGPAGPGGFCSAPESGSARLVVGQEGAWQ
jgi:hypothetical protein